MTLHLLYLNFDGAEDYLAGCECYKDCDVAAICECQKMVGGEDDDEELTPAYDENVSSAQWLD